MENELKFLANANAEEDTRHISEYSSLNLAYIGDCVYELFVRTHVLKKYNGTVNKMDAMSRNFVKASAQSQYYHVIFDKCTDLEQSVLKRGRNAKSYTKAKNASTNDYQHATGLEALFGYLYLKGEYNRLEELFNYILEDDKE